jgi:hypothetical protein
MLFQDVRYGLRMLVKSPGFSTIAVLSLALGIGANTAIFSLVNAVLLRPLPVTDSARLLTVSTTDQKNPGNLPLSHLNFNDLRSQNSAFTDMAAFTFNQVNYSAGRESEQIPVQVVTANYFSLLGVQPALGRAFLPEEEKTAAPVAVISDGFWQRSLGSDPSVVGKTLTLNRVPYTVIGVAPKHFAGTLLGGGPSAWLPMSQPLRAADGVVEHAAGTVPLSRSALAGPASQPRRPVESRDGVRKSRGRVSRRLGRSATAVPLLAARLDPNGRGGNPDHAAALVAADGRRRHRAADCVRQHRESAAGTRVEAAPRSGHPARDGREALAADRAAPHRERHALAARRRRRLAARVLVHRRDRHGAAAAPLPG